MAAKWLADQKHQVVLHARNEKRAQHALESVPGAEEVLTADRSSIKETKQLAADVNAIGRFDAVIHNAGVYRASGKEIFAVNTLAPYILTCLIQKPQRLIYLSSSMHLQGDPSLKHITSAKGNISYSDSKLYVLLHCCPVKIRKPLKQPGWWPIFIGSKCDSLVWTYSPKPDVQKFWFLFFFKLTRYSRFAQNRVLNLTGQQWCYY